MRTKSETVVIEASGSTEASFDRLFGSGHFEHFIDANYEKNFVHVRRNSVGYFDYLFSLKAAEEILWSREPHLEDTVRYHRAGSEVDPPWSLGRLDRLAWSATQFQNGVTIIINNLEDTVSVLAHFVRDIENSLDARVSVAAYLTPAGARAFDPHFDPHDVIIAQVEGRKSYSLYGHAHSPYLPFRRQQAELLADNLGEPTSTVQLEVGDVLYLPRGMVHAAVTDDAHSVHLTFSIHPPKVADLASTAIELAAEEDPALRNSLIGLKGEAGNELVERLSKALGVAIDPQMVRDRIRRRFIGRLRPLPAQRLRSGIRKLVAVQPTDWLEKVPGAICAISLFGRNLRLSFPGTGVITDDRMPTYLEIPAGAEDAIRYIDGAGRPFQAASLPDSLSDPSKLMLASFLVREGLLQVSDAQV